MRIGPPRTVKCPFCGKEKKLISLISGNTFDAEHWSDNKLVAPSLPNPSPVQKCPCCGKYYFTDKQECMVFGASRKRREVCTEKGNLSYPEWKEAYEQFIDVEKMKVVRKGFYPFVKKKDYLYKVDKEDIERIRLWLIQAYNDYYYRQPKSVDMLSSPLKERGFINGIIADFFDAYDWRSERNELFKAELYREASEMEKCRKVLESIVYEELTDFEKNVYQTIKTKMEYGSYVVFEIKERRSINS